MLEGAVLFAASAVRRLEFGDRAMLSAPFVVRSRMGTAGAASAGDDEDSRNEIWVPLWAVPCGVDEVRSLLSEGRATLDGRSARDGLDFARAVAQLGINRGIRSFQRYAFLRRQGKNFLATPLSRIAVRRNPDADLIAELERRSIESALAATRGNKVSAAKLLEELHRVCRPDGDIFLVNHFQSDNRVMGALERALGSVSSQIGFDPQVDLRQLVPAAQNGDVSRVNLFWKMVRLRNGVSHKL